MYITDICDRWIENYLRSDWLNEVRHVSWPISEVRDAQLIFVILVENYTTLEPKFLPVRPVGRYIKNVNFSATIQDRLLKVSVKIPYINEHPLYNLLGPSSVCWSDYKKHVWFRDFLFVIFCIKSFFIIMFDHIFCS